MVSASLAATPPRPRHDPARPRHPPSSHTTHHHPPPPVVCDPSKPSVSDMIACADEGTPKRPGGLGDFLAGSIGVHVAWAYLVASYHLVAGSVVDDAKEGMPVDKAMACHSACVLLRRASRAAYVRNKRAMVAPDLLGEIGPAFEEICPADGIVA